MSVFSDIQEYYHMFSRGQRLIADYILNHYDKAAFMTASKLGATVGVSESTVVRFAAEIGLGGYPSLQSELQEMIRNKLTSVQRIEVANDQIGMDDDIVARVLNLDIEHIRKTLQRISKDDFEAAVDKIVNANRIYILGSRSASALARFMEFYFNLMFDSVKLIHTTSTSEMFEQILRIHKEDVIIGISFPRYSRQTVEAFEYSSKRGASVIAITDTNKSPLVKSADHVLLARSDMMSFVDSLVAPLSLINALIVAAGLRKKDDVASAFHSLESIWEEYHVYEKLEEGTIEREN